MSFDIVFSKQFEKQARKLQTRQRQKLATLLGLLAENPFDSKLHSKSLSEPLSGVWSFRITREWRVTFHFIDSKTIRLIEVKHRKDIYR